MTTCGDNIVLSRSRKKRCEQAISQVEKHGIRLRILASIAGIVIFRIIANKTFSFS